MAKDIANGNQPDGPAVFFDDGQMPIAPDVHFLKSQCHPIVGADRFRIGRHVFAKRPMSIVGDEADDFTQVVAFGQDSDKTSIAVDDQERADAVFDAIDSCQ